eukprot:753904_1
MPTQGITQHTYRHGQYDKLGMERIFTKGMIGLQNFPRAIRGALAHDCYFDIDIRNCHPIILHHICKKKKTPDKKKTSHVKEIQIKQKPTKGKNRRASFMDKVY